MSEKCKTCNRSIPEPHLTKEQFKKQIKVGDYIYGFSTNKKVRVTAIGVDRFLYTSPDYKNRLEEKVGTMDSYTSRWRKLP